MRRPGPGTTRPLTGAVLFDDSSIRVLYYNRTHSAEILMRFSSVALLLSLIFHTGCGGFVSLVPAPGAVSASTAPAATEGYLRIYLWSDLTALEQKAANFSDFDGELQDLSVTVEPLFGTTSEGEFPIAMFNLETKVKETVASLDVNKAQYVNLESGSQVAFKFHVRAIPKSIATAYKQAAAQVEDIANTLPTQTIASWAPQLQSATKVLSIFTSAADQKNEKEWTSDWTVGLKASDNAELPLDDTAYKMFLVPTSKDIKLSTLLVGVHSCPANPSRLCQTVGATEIPFSAVPYLTIRATLADYRPITDFTYDLTCNRTADELGQIRSALSGAKMLPKRRIYEGYLVERLSTLLAMQTKDALSTVNTVSDFAYKRLVLFQSAPDDASWVKHYAAASKTLEDCIDKTPAQNGFIAGQRWIRIQKANNNRPHVARLFRNGPPLHHGGKAIALDFSGKAYLVARAIPVWARQDRAIVSGVGVRRFANPDTASPVL